MLKCTKISIKEYYNYKNVDLTFDPKVNVFIGKNAAGKSFFLKFMRNLTRGKIFGIEKTNMNFSLEFQTEVDLSYTDYFDLGLNLGDPLTGTLSVENTLEEQSDLFDNGDLEQPSQLRDLKINFSLKKNNKSILVFEVSKKRISFEMGDFSYNGAFLLTNLKNLTLDGSFMDSIGTSIESSYLKHLEGKGIKKYSKNKNNEVENEIGFEIFVTLYSLNPFQFKSRWGLVDNFLPSDSREYRLENSQTFSSDSKANFRAYKKNSEGDWAMHITQRRNQRTDSVKSLSGFLNYFIFRHDLVERKSKKFTLNEDHFSEILLQESVPFKMFFTYSRFSEFVFTGITIEAEKDTHSGLKSKDMSYSGILNYSIRLKDKKGKIVTLSQLTPGEERFLILTLLMEKNDGRGTIYLDEMENGFHPEWIIEILNNSENYQMFISTHNPFVLDKSFLYVGNEDEDEISNVHIISQEEEVVTIRNLSNDEEGELIERQDKFGDPSGYLIQAGIW